jgi:hypothetical protein
MLHGVDPRHLGPERLAFPAQVADQAGQGAALAHVALAPLGRPFDEALEPAPPVGLLVEGREFLRQPAAPRLDYGKGQLLLCAKVVEHVARREARSLATSASEVPA